MKVAFKKFSFFIRKYFLAEFIFILIFYGVVMYYLNEIDKSNSDSPRRLFLQVTLFAFFMTLVNRFLRNNVPFKPQPMELGDHASYFAKGQRSKLKAYLEGKGYSINRNEGVTTYFDPPENSTSQTYLTFIYETDHWMALVASNEIRDAIPMEIDTLYPHPLTA